MEKFPWDVKAGDLLVATDARGEEHECVAVSGYEGTHHGGTRKVHDFPVVWIRLTTKGSRIPWPVESLQPMEAHIAPADKPRAHAGATADGQHVLGNWAVA